MDCLIRETKIEDIPEILALMLHTGLSTQPVQGVHLKQLAMADIVPHLKSTYVVEKDGKVHGFILAPGTVVKLRDVGVMQDYAGYNYAATICLTSGLARRGYGRHLVSKLLYTNGKVMTGVGADAVPRKFVDDPTAIKLLTLSEVDQSSTPYLVEVYMKQ